MRTEKELKLIDQIHLGKRRYLIENGTKFGKLTVLEYVGKSETKELLYRCRCDCNKRNEKIVSGKNLRIRGVTSCGCAANRICDQPIDNYRPFPLELLTPDQLELYNSLCENWGQHGQVYAIRYLKLQQKFREAKGVA